jgi:hypothetical protein
MSAPGPTTSTDKKTTDNGAVSDTVGDKDITVDRYNAPIDASRYTGDPTNGQQSTVGPSNANTGNTGTQRAVPAITGNHDRPSTVGPRTRSQTAGTNSNSPSSNSKLDTKVPVQPPSNSATDRRHQVINHGQCDSTRTPRRSRRIQHRRARAGKTGTEVYTAEPSSSPAAGVVPEL